MAKFYLKFFISKVEMMWKLSYKLSKLFKTPDLSRPLRVALTIKSRLEKFKLNIPLLHIICNPGLKMRHWKSMNDVLGFEITPTDETSLKDILKNSSIIEKSIESLIEISSLATKEFALEQALKKMKNDWFAMQLSFVQYKDTNLMILSSFDEIQTLLDDHIIKTSTIKNSPFVAAFEKDVDTWTNQLVAKNILFLTIIS